MVLHSVPALHKDVYKTVYHWNMFYFPGVSRLLQRSSSSFQCMPKSQQEQKYIFIQKFHSILLVHDKYPQFQFSFKNNLWCNFNYNILHGFTFCTCTSSSSTGTVLKYYYYYHYYYVTVRLVLQEKMRWHFSEQRWEWSDGCVALR